MRQGKGCRRQSHYRPQHLSLHQWLYYPIHASLPPPTPHIRQTATTFLAAKTCLSITPSNAQPQPQYLLPVSHTITGTDSHWINVITPHCRPQHRPCRLWKSGISTEAPKIPRLRHMKQRKLQMNLEALSPMAWGKTDLQINAKK